MFHSKCNDCLSGYFFLIVYLGVKCDVCDDVDAASKVARFSAAGCDGHGFDCSSGARITYASQGKDLEKAV